MGIHIAIPASINRINLLILVGSVLFALWFFATNWGFVNDDTYITFRYAQNINLGHGIVFNAGDRVEGYSNLLFLLSTALLAKFGIDYLFAARLLSVTALFVMAIVAYRFVSTSSENKEHASFFATLAVLCLCCSVPLLSWAISGLESSFTASLLALAVILLAKHFHSPTGGTLVPSAIMFVLVALSRADGALFGGIACLMLTIDLLRYGQTSRRQCMEFIGVFALYFICHTLWRYQYYGDILPNTYYAKLYGIPFTLLMHKGLDYIWAFFKAPPYLFVFVVIFTAFGFSSYRQSRFHYHVDHLFLAIIAASLLYMIKIGGDWMPAFRMLVPIIPIMIIYCCYMASQCSASLSPKNQLTITALVIFFHVAQFSYPYTQFRPQLAQNHAYWDQIANHINKHWPKSATIATNLAGYLPYKLPEYTFLDMLGLNNKIIAKRADIPLSILAPLPLGHMKGDGKYVLSQLPDYIIPGATFERNDITKSRFISDQELLANHLEELYTKHTIHITASLPLHSQAITQKSHRTVEFFYYKKR